MRLIALVLVMSTQAACDLSTAPETRESPNEFAVRAEWTANLTSAAALRGSARVVERFGSQMDVTASLTGATPSGAYQWRIFRGSCAATLPADLVLFNTIQAYPDLRADASGTVTSTRLLAGALDSTRAYSVRIRAATSLTNWNGSNPLACGNLARP